MNDINLTFNSLGRFDLEDMITDQLPLLVDDCESTPDKAFKIVADTAEEQKATINALYDLVKDSDQTVDEVVSYEPYRVSFKNGSYIRVLLKEGGDG